MYEHRAGRGIGLIRSRRGVRQRLRRKKAESLENIVWARTQKSLKPWAIGTVVVLLSDVLPFACGVGVRPRVFYARRQREGDEGPLRNRRLRRSAAIGGGI